MFWSAYVMFGVPEETVKDIRMTMEMLERLQPSFITAARFSPLPGTPMYEEIARSGRKVDWVMENNMCIGPCYCRHIPEPQFHDLMERILEYVADYNRRHSNGSTSRDRRITGRGDDGGPAARVPASQQFDVVGVAERSLRRHAALSTEANRWQTS
jgi:hypothetical protein